MRPVWQWHPEDRRGWPMSAAAEALVRAFKHPYVKGSRRALLNKIAELIPEGQTMTAPIASEDLATLIGYYDQALRKARDVLVAIGAVRIVGGGRGRLASYELLLLDGAGAPPALPLRADLRAVAPRAAEGPTLFDPPIVDDGDASAPDAIRGDNLGENHRPLFFPIGKVGDFHRRLLRAIVTNVGTFHRRWSRIVTKVGEKYRRVVTSPHLSGASDLGEFGTRPSPPVDDARAREVRTHVQERTHTRDAGAATELPPVLTAVEPVQHPWHAWCAGRVHVPKALHAELLRTHPRQTRETDADVESWLIAFYATTCAALPSDQPIPPNEYTFWRRAYAAARTPPVRAPTTDDVWTRAAAYAEDRRVGPTRRPGG
jgi:hypothetical protein